MARETKVGLIAGLAFIICFAVILANRGQTRPLPHGAPSDRVAANTASPTASSAPRTRGSSESSPSPGIRTTPNRVDRPSPATPKFVRDRTTLSPGGNPPPSGAEITWPGAAEPGDARTRESGRGPGSSPSSRDETFADASRLSAETPPRNVIPGSGSEVGTADRERLLNELRSNEESRAAVRSDRFAEREARSPIVAAPAGAGTDGTGSRRPNDPGARLASGKRYVVAAGDSLSGIAARYYGSKSKGILSAIVEANRGVIDDPDRLSAGVELVLPELSSPASKQPTSQDRVDEPPPGKFAPKAAEKLAKAPAKDAAKATPEHGDGSSKVRWYQVKRDDRYMSIARSQLGDSGRWKELYELNKDRFPDPAKIREGVRIKLPSGTTALAEARR